MYKLRWKALTLPELEPYTTNGGSLMFELKTNFGETIGGTVRRIDTKTSGTQVLLISLIADLTIFNQYGLPVAEHKRYKLTFDHPVVVESISKPPALHLRSWGEYMAIKMTT